MTYGIVRKLEMYISVLAVGSHEVFPSRTFLIL